MRNEIYEIGRHWYSVCFVICVYTVRTGNHKNKACESGMRRQMLHLNQIKLVLPLCRIYYGRCVCNLLLYYNLIDHV